MLGEELSPTMTDRAGLVFVADPLDGTTNFLHGLPWYAVSIAAMVDGELAAGAVLNVANGELFTATRRRRRAAERPADRRLADHRSGARADRHRLSVQGRRARR